MDIQQNVAKQPEAVGGSPGDAGRARQFTVEAALLQVFSVVLGILLALAVNQWQEHVRDDRLVRESLGAVRQEITANAAQLRRVQQDHATLRIAIQRLEKRHQREKIVPLDEFVTAMRRDAPQGLTVPLLDQTAWDAALAAQAPALMDYRTRALLAGVYHSQQALTEELTNVERLLLTPENLEPTRLYYSLYAADRNLDGALAAEDNTLRLYATVLRRLPPG